MRAKPDFLHVNELVRVNGYVGLIVDIAESDSSIMVRVDSAKCARRFQKPDWLEYTAVPGMWEPASLDDLLHDAEQEKQAALKSVRAVDDYVRRVVADLEMDKVATGLSSVAD